MTLFGKSGAMFRLCLAAGLVLSCGDDKPQAQVKEVVAETGVEEIAASPVIPVLESECQRCHVLDNLGRKLSDDNAGIREWMAAQGTGLVRSDPAFPVPGIVFALPWPERGWHGEDSRNIDTCSDCHPVEENGIGHGVRTYPENARELAFAGGESCADGCHGWLAESVVSEGFRNGLGKVPVFNGSLRPEALLESGGNAHSDLFKKGAHPEELPMKIASFNAGCGGCHNVASESHGAIPSCVGCHSFKGTEGEKLRASIVAHIEKHVVDNDPDRPGDSACIYCHRQDESDPERSNRACYNCHLSGHQPLNGDGDPHFWPGQP